MSTEKKTVLTHEEICRVGVRKLKERKKALIIATLCAVFCLVITPFGWWAIMIAAIFAVESFFLWRENKNLQRRLQCGDYFVTTSVLVKKTSHWIRGKTNYEFSFSNRCWYILSDEEARWYDTAQEGDIFYLICRRKRAVSPLAIYPASEYVWEESN